MACRYTELSGYRIKFINENHAFPSLTGQKRFGFLPSLHYVGYFSLGLCGEFDNSLKIMVYLKLMSTFHSTQLYLFTI